MATEELLLTSALSSNFTACLWNYKTLNVQKHYKGGGDIAPKCLEFLGQDYMLAAELEKPLLHIWPLNSQQIAKNMRMVLPEPATCLSVCPHNIYLAVGIGCKLYIWHLPSGKLLSVTEKHYQPITCIKYSSSGDIILVGGQDGFVFAYMLSNLVAFNKKYQSETNLGQPDTLYEVFNHSEGIRDIHTGLFGRKSRFATVSNDQICRIYDILNGNKLLDLVFQEVLSSVIFDTPCWKLFVGTDSGAIMLFNLKNPPRVLQHHVEETSISHFVNHNKKIVCLALNRTNTILVSGSEDHNVITWDVQSRQILKKIEHKNAITNIKFVLNYQQFFVDSLKPTIVIKSLERSLCNQEGFKVCQAQTEDIDMSDEDEDSLCKSKSVTKVLEENRKLRVVNKQLYLSAVEMSKRYNKSKA